MIDRILERYFVRSWRNWLLVAAMTFTAYDWLRIDDGWGWNALWRVVVGATVLVLIPGTRPPVAVTVNMNFPRADAAADRVFDAARGSVRTWES